MKNFTIGTINILNKGDFSKRYTLLCESEQLDSIDVLCIQEVVDEKLLKNLLYSKGFTYHTYSEKMIDNRGRRTNSLGIFSRTPLINDGHDYAMKEHRGNIFGRATIIHNVRFNIFTIHAAWGALNEHKRLIQSEIVEKYAKELEERYLKSVSVYCGDFNSDEDNRSIRFINGKDLNSSNDYSTLWLDSHTVAGTNNNWTTSDHSTNNLGKETARWAGIEKTEYLPKRRIDYIFVRGWCYGKNGFPIDFDYIKHPKGEELSDHNGIYSKLLIL